MSVEQAIQDLERLEPTTRKYIIENLDALMEDFVLFEAKAASMASNLPEEFTDGIAWKRTGDLSGKIINTWGDEEKPLAKWFEQGTPDHWIGPSTPDGVLAFEASFGQNASAIYFMGNAKPGSMIFSKGHYVSGLPKTEAMQRGINTGFKRMQSAILKNTKSDVSKELETIA